MAKPLSKKIGAFALMTWLCVFSGPMLLLVSLFFDGNPISFFISANFYSWLTVIFLGFFMQPIGYAAWYYVLKKYPVNKVMPVLLVLPLTGLITSIFLLGESPPNQVFFVCLMPPKHTLLFDCLFDATQANSICLFA